MLRALLIFLLEDHALVEDRAPVRSFEDPFLFEPFQVAPDRRFGGVQQSTQINRPRDLVDCQIFLNSLPPLCWNEGFAHRFGLSYLDGK
jgi:hypothetical protein